MTPAPAGAPWERITEAMAKDPNHAAWERYFAEENVLAEYASLREHADKVEAVIHQHDDTPSPVVDAVWDLLDELDEVLAKPTGPQLTFWLD